MAWEVERKARIPDPERVAAILTQRYGSPLYSRKHDQYYLFPDDSGSRFRLRVVDTEPGEGVPGVVTWKSRTMEQGMEINDEQEFSVSCATTFSDLVLRMGCTPLAIKKKDTRAWRLNHGLLAELSRVERLGWFLEIESVIQSRDGVDEAKRLVDGVYQELSIPPSDYEPQSYLSMLAELGL